MSAGSPGLLERSRELETLHHSLEAAAAGRGGVLVIEGPAGVGKSALLRELAARGREAGLRVLSAIGSELEREYPYGMVRQLLEAEVLGAAPERRAQLLSGASALAAPVLGAASPETGAGAGTGTETETGIDSSFATLHGLYWLVATLADEQPHLLVLDDSHWADVSSLRCIDFLARRVGELPVLIAVGVRTGEPGAETALLHSIADGDDAIVLRPRPLSPAATHELVGRRLGERAGEAVTEAAYTATQGNPLLVSELALALADSDSELTAATVNDVVPSSVSRSVQRRVDGLPEDARTVARALATLGERTRPELLALAAGLDAGVTAEALETLRARNLIAPEGSTFVHPLVRQAVADGVPASERHRLHAVVARGLHDRGLDAEEVIVHLLAGPPLHAGWARDALRAGARRALAEGAPESAARRLARALEEADGPDDPALLLELGEALLRAGDPSGLSRLSLAAQAEDPVIAARAVMAIVQAQSMSEDFDGHAVGARLRAALDRLGPGAPTALEDLLMGTLISASTLNNSLLAQRRALLAAERDRRLPVLLALRAYDGACGDLPNDEVIALAQEGMEAAPFSQLSQVESGHAWWGIGALHLIDASELADGALTVAENTARRHGSRMGRAWVLTVRSHFAVQFGSVAVGEAVSREAIELWSAMGFERLLTTAVAQLVGALVLRGELEEAERELAVCTDEDAPFTRAMMLLGRAPLRLAQRRTAEAVRDLREVQEVADALGQRRFGWGHTGVQLAMALLADGRTEEAAAIAAEELAVAQRAGRLSLRVGALTALGLASRGPEQLEALEAAAVAGRDPCAPLTSATAKLEYGAALRRAGHPSDAREWLREGHAIASRADCRTLADRAVQELVIAGGRPRSKFSVGLESLTPSERRVAEHAADGLTNREIAETLFVTRKTVELHLGHAYGKLGIRSRAQLPEALGAARATA